jgi:hypothetical protein
MTATLTRFVRRLLPAAVVLASLALPAGAAAAVELSSDPALHPSFDRGIADYVVRCRKDGSLALSVRASEGERVAIGSHDARGGDFTDTLNRHPGGGVTVRVESSTRPGTYHLRCLPRDFPRWDVSRPGAPQASGYVVTPNGRAESGYVAVLDSRATPVWWRHASSYGPWDAKIFPGGHIGWTHYKGGPFGQLKAYGYEERRLDGHRVRRIRTDETPTDTHDLQRLPNGHYLALTYVARSGVDLRKYGGDRRSRVYDGELQELTPGGRVVWRWSSHGHIKTSETRWWDTLNGAQKRKDPDERFWDLVHINSVEPDGDALIVSFRHLDAVYKIDRDTGKIVWKLGGTRRPESLDVIGDPLGDRPFSGQHDARLWNGTLTVFDNETNRDRAPRAVRYVIDEGTHTARLVEQVDPPDDLRSGFGGSARKLPGGNWVIYWGGAPLFTEQEPESGTQALGVSLRHEHWGLRVVPLPQSVGIPSLRRAMDRMVARTHKASWR